MAKGDKFEATPRVVRKGGVVTHIGGKTVLVGGDGKAHKAELMATKRHPKRTVTHEPATQQQLQAIYERDHIVVGGEKVYREKLVRKISGESTPNEGLTQ